MKHIQTFDAFFTKTLSEELDQTRHKAVKHIEDIETLLPCNRNYRGQVCIKCHVLTVE